MDTLHRNCPFKVSLIVRKDNQKGSGRRLMGRTLVGWLIGLLKVILLALLLPLKIMKWLKRIVRLRRTIGVITLIICRRYRKRTLWFRLINRRVKLVHRAPLNWLLLSRAFLTIR